MIYDLTIKDSIIFRETIKKIVVPLWIFLIVSTIVLAREGGIFKIAFKHYTKNEAPDEIYKSRWVPGATYRPK